MYLSKCVNLHQKIVTKSKWEYWCDLVAMMEKEIGKDHLYPEIFIQDDEPYIMSTIAK